MAIVSIIKMDNHRGAYIVRPEHLDIGRPMWITFLDNIFEKFFHKKLIEILVVDAIINLNSRILNLFKKHLTKKYTFIVTLTMSNKWLIHVSSPNI